MIDMIVGVYRALTAERFAECLVGSIGDHLVAVHVRLGARSGLIDHQWKVIIEISGDHLVCGALDGTRDFRRNPAEIGVDRGCGLFDESHRPDQRTSHPLLPDAEVL